MALFDSIKGGASELLTKATGGVSGLLNPKNARMAISGLFPGGASSAGKVASNISFDSGGGSPSRPEDDWRVRISLSPQNKIFYNDKTNSLLAPLSDTDGVIFPHTPQISVTHSAVYNSSTPTHSNYASQFYQSSEVNDITISGDFTVQTAEEGQYLLAAIYFFRSATKMFFGLDDTGGTNAGNPPPLVYLDGYGSHYFPHVQCVITQFTHTMPNEVDYINVPIALTEVKNYTTEIASVQGMEAGKDFPSHLLSSGSKTGQTTQSSYQEVVTTGTASTRLPTNSSISITLRPVYSRKSLHEKFNLEDFAAGRLVGGNNGGFL